MVTIELFSFNSPDCPNRPNIIRAQDKESAMAYVDAVIANSPIDHAPFVFESGGVVEYCMSRHFSSIVYARIHLNGSFRCQECNRYATRRISAGCYCEECYQNLS